MLRKRQFDKPKESRKNETVNVRVEINELGNKYRVGKVFLNRTKMYYS